VSKHSSSPGRGAPLPPLCKDPSPSHLPPIAAPAFRRIDAAEEVALLTFAAPAFSCRQSKLRPGVGPSLGTGPAGRRRAFSWLNISLFGSSEGMSDGGAINAAASTPRS
jgi:hypothetical protein